MVTKIKLMFVLIFLLSLNEIRAQDIALDLGGQVGVSDASKFIKNSGNSYFKLIVTNNGPGNLPQHKIRPQISLPAGKVTFSTTASDHIIPTGWTILSNNGQTITLSNGTNQLADGDGHIILLKINPLVEGSYVSVANLLFSNGTAPGSSNGPQLPGDDTGNQGLPFAYSVEPSLPVTLVSFTAAAENITANLAWSTTLETNSDRFEIQHSSNTKDWRAIGTVASNGESKIKRDYTFTDRSPVNGNNYYRLKMIDKDATFAYSSIRTLAFENLITTMLYPNPVSDKLTIESKSWASVTGIEIANLTGAIVYKTTGSNLNNQLDLKSLAAGVYVVKLKGQNGTSSVHKIVVSK